MKKIFSTAVIFLCLSIFLPRHSYAQNGKVEDAVSEVDKQEEGNSPTIAAQRQISFVNKQVDINAGVGFYSQLDDPIQNFTIKTAVPLISVAADFGITDNISLGGFAGITKVNITQVDLQPGYRDSLNGTTIKPTSTTVTLADITHIVVGIRALYHFKTHSRFDPYAGAMIGYNYAMINIRSPYVDKSQLQTNTYISTLIAGCRYRFSDNFGAFLEFGYGVSIVNLGMNFKLSNQKQIVRQR